MSGKTLRQLYQDHRGKVTDKWSGYIDEYDRLFREYQDRPLNLLEIGVLNGGSLEIWAQYFPKANKIVGCDINPVCGRLGFDDPRISVVVGDANADLTQTEISRLSSQFDIIIDDGSHKSSDVVMSFLRYFSRLADGGIYMVEDMHASYWAEYEGGLSDPLSSMTFFKRLADLLNREHWENEWDPTSLFAGFTARHGLQADPELLAHLHSIQFTNSLCIVQKEAPPRNQLGTRIVAGSDAAVDRTVLGLHRQAASSARMRQPTDVDSVSPVHSQGEQYLHSTVTESGQVHEQIQALATQLLQAEQRTRDAAALVASQRTELAGKETALQRLLQQYTTQSRALESVSSQSAAKDTRISDLTTTLKGIQETRSWKTAQLLARLYRRFWPRRPDHPAE
jgi:predicted O-methyltransferase YrrM